MLFNGKMLSANGVFHTEWSEDFEELQRQIDELKQQQGMLPAPLVLVEGEHYGTELPAAGTRGRLFFKVVE